MARPKIISLYTGAGGLDFGFEAAGFDTGVAVELDHDACETIRENRPEWHPIERSIFDVTTAEMLATAGLKKGEADLVAGGPPCQPFSKSGYWARGDALRLEDPRSDTLGAYMRVVEEAQPKAFLLENVGGLAYDGKDEGLRLLLRRIEEINAHTGTNYQPSYQVVRAADYGVPQIRERFILVAQREGTKFQFPAATHAEATGGEGHLPGLALEPYHTAWDALGDVKPTPAEDVAPKGAWADLLPSIPEGENYLWHTPRKGGMPLFGWRTRYWGFLLKLAKNKPSWTVQAQPGPAIGPFHWESRRLSMREMCRIQCFPDDVTIVGSRVSMVRQVGNAVPSLLTEVLGRAIRTQLLGLEPVEGPLKLKPPRRTPVPAAETVAPVPQKFHHLAGNHAPHPGTGKGRGALERARDARDAEAKAQAKLQALAKVKKKAAMAREQSAEVEQPSFDDASKKARAKPEKSRKARVESAQAMTGKAPKRGAAVPKGRPGKKPKAPVQPLKGAAGQKPGQKKKRAKAAA